MWNTIKYIIQSQLSDTILWDGLMNVVNFSKLASSVHLKAFNLNQQEMLYYSRARRQFLVDHINIIFR